MLKQSCLISLFLLLAVRPSHPCDTNEWSQLEDTEMSLDESARERFHNHEKDEGCDDLSSEKETIQAEIDNDKECGNLALAIRQQTKLRQLNRRIANDHCDDAEN